MNKDTLKSYYEKSIKTFEFTKVNGEAFWATVTLILCKEGHIQQEEFAEVMEVLGSLPAYASNMEKQMVELKLLDQKQQAESLAAKYLAKAKTA